MLDLNNLFRVTSIIVNIYSNGEIRTVNQNGVRIEKLSGNWSKLKTLAKLINKNTRREFIASEYNDTILPSLEFYFVILGNKGEDVIRQQVNEVQIAAIAKYIK